MVLVEVTGRGRDLTGLPCRNLVGESHLPQAWESVTQVERQPQEDCRGGVAHTKGCSEFKDGELGHLGRSIATETPQRLMPGQHGSGLVQHRIEVGVVGCEHQFAHLERTSLGLEVAHGLDRRDVADGQIVAGTRARDAGQPDGFHRGHVTSSRGVFDVHVLSNTQPINKVFAQVNSTSTKPLDGLGDHDVRVQRRVTRTVSPSMWTTPFTMKSMSIRPGAHTCGFTAASATW